MPVSIYDAFSTFLSASVSLDSWDIPGTLASKLCTGCSSCLECFPPRYPYGSLRFLWFYSNVIFSVKSSLALLSRIYYLPGSFNTHTRTPPPSFFFSLLTVLLSTHHLLTFHLFYLLPLHQSLRAGFFLVSFVH